MVPSAIFERPLFLSFDLLCATRSDSMAADLIGWLTRGGLIVTEQDVQRMRIAGLTIAPAMSGLLLSLVTMLWRRPHHDKGIMAS
jgi:hypothetical protein